jgi:hypothetical protein
MHPYQSKRRGNARAHHILAAHSGGSASCKAKGGAVAPARGNNSEAVMRGMQHSVAEESPVYTEGAKRSKRIPRKSGGKVAGKPMKVNIVNIHAHHPGMMMPPGGPPMGAGAPPPPPGVMPPVGPAASLPPPGAVPGMMRNQGGAVDTSYGAASGMSRLAEYRRMKGEH